MDAQQVFAFGQQGLTMLLTVAAPMLLTVLVVGLVVSIFQAATQINEATLSFVPKILAAVAVMAIAGPWMLSTLVEYHPAHAAGDSRRPRLTRAACRRHRLAMITFTEAQLTGWVIPLLWPFLRVLALAVPVLGQRNVPTRVRIGLAGFIAGIRVSLPPMPVVPLDSPEALAIVAQQVMIGLTLGFATRLVFAAVELGGELIGLQMGLNFAGFFDPMSASQGTASARFLGTMASFLFIVINGHLFLIAAVVQSFHSFPAGPEVLGFLRVLEPQTWATELFRLGLTIALPIVGMLLFVNLVLGMISRVAPQVNVFAIGFPITLSVGLLGLLFTLPMMRSPVQAALEAMLARFT